MFAGLFLGIIYRTQYKIRKKHAGRFFVQEVKRETSDTFTLALKPEKPFYFKAGQFCFLRINKNRLFARHPFTMSSAPQEPNLYFTIKQSGRFTKTAFELKNGEEVIIDGPFGKFIIKDRKKDLVFIAGGVGITPFMSMLKEHLNKKLTQKITLLYGSKTEQDIIFKNEIDTLDESWFKKIYVLSQGNSAAASCEPGFITQALIEKYVKNIDNSLFYICGPEVLKSSVKKSLADLGVKKKNIIIEDFFW